MALQGSGAISLSNVQTEFGGADPINFNEYYRNGGYVTSNNTSVPTSGTISLSQFYNARKGFIFNQTLSGTTMDYNLRSAAISGGWDQVTALIATITINGGVVVGSSSTGSYAFNTGSSFPAGSILVLSNSGYILGRGGNAGAGGYDYAAGYGGGGGPALIASAAITIYNYGVIGGGGGGGGGGRALPGAYGSQGGSGGAGYYSGSRAGGSYGGGGDWGNDGALTSGGGGGNGGLNYNSINPNFLYIGGAGPGGGLGSSGGWYVATGYDGGGAGGGPGAAGACTSGNGNITWGATGSRYGALN